MDVLYPRCAGLDVHKDTVVAAVRIAANGPATTEVRTFDTTTPGLLALSGWLAEYGKPRASTGSRSGTSSPMAMSSSSWPTRHT